MQPRFKVTDWIKGQSIKPFCWGDSAENIIDNFKGARQEVLDSITTGTPYIVLDFVEFYFDDDQHLHGLNTIIIKCVSLYKGIRPVYLDKDWLRRDLSYVDTCKKLKRLNIEYTVHYLKSDIDTPVLTTSGGQIFVFYDHSLEPECPLHKIYIQK